jgi:hypothetical protein
MVIFWMYEMRFETVSQFTFINEFLPDMSLRVIRAIANELMLDSVNYLDLKFILLTISIEIQNQH